MLFVSTGCSIGTDNRTFLPKPRDLRSKKAATLVVKGSSPNFASNIKRI